ncbi:hypothetical protein M3J09_002190 [Ascochyta lentis]
MIGEESASTILAAALHYVASRFYVAYTPFDLSLVIQFPHCLAAEGILYIVIFSHTAHRRRDYIQFGVDLSLRGQPPIPSEESGEVRPRAKARVSGRSRNPIAVEDANRH